MPNPWEKYGSGPWSKYQETEGPPAMTLDKRAEDVFGLDPNIKRSAILPIGTRNGEMEFALPQFAADMVKSITLPGHVMKGGEYDLEDVNRFAMDIAVPGSTTMPRTPSSLTPPKPGFAKPPVAPSGRAAFRELAPSTEDLRSKAGGLYRDAKNSGVVVRPESFDDLLYAMKFSAKKEGLNDTLHPKLTAVLKAIDGDSADINSLQIVRRQLGVAAKSLEPDERRIADNLIDKFDDFIDNLSSADVVSGDARGLGNTLSEARKTWSQMRKSELMEQVVERAGVSASGFENGVRNELRKIVNSPKKVRGFSEAEVKAMKKVIEGSMPVKALRLFGKMGFGGRGGSNFLGGSIGTAAGGAIAGPAGALAAPMMGLSAQHGAASMTGRAVNDIRAMAATGRELPMRNFGPVARTGMRAVPPVVAADGPRTIEEYQRMIREGRI